MSAVRVGDRVRFSTPAGATVEGQVWSEGSRPGRVWVLDDEQNSHDVMHRYLSRVGAVQLVLPFESVSA